MEPDISTDSDSVNDVVFGTPSWTPTESPADTDAGAIHPRGPLTSPPRIDGVSVGRSPTRKISEDPESGGVHPRDPPTSPVVDLMEILVSLVVNIKQRSLFPTTEYLF